MYSGSDALARSQLSSLEPLALPELQRDEPPVPFPVVAAVAPVIVAVAMWLVTHSPFVLVFAVLGPVVAFASVADRRMQRRRAAKRARRERREALDALTRALEERHDDERRELLREHPSPLEFLEGVDAAWVWHPSRSGVHVAIGLGETGSTQSITGKPSDDDERALCASARVLRSAPVVVDVCEGIGIVGPRVAARSLARSLVCRLACRLSPDSLHFTAPAAVEWEWCALLPHAAAHAPSAGEPGEWASRTAAEKAAARVTIGELVGSATVDARGGALVVVAESRERLPPLALIVEHDAAAGWRIVTASDARLVGRVIDPELVSEGEARLVAERLSTLAEARGIGALTRLPERLSLAELAQPEREHASLNAAIGATATAALEVDLVRDGPHAVVGGMTGSGKSELLSTWVCAMADGRSPNEVSFLLIDFKGGAAFAPLQKLPHCVGLVTDLDESGAQRAVESLRAELRYREHFLAQAGVADLARLESNARLARLVIVVDEFASMLSTFPAFHDVFSDIAARGRSLGVHVIVSTQRLVGVVRDSLLANCPLRLSLRVTSATDSSTILGTDAAARLPALPRGRVVVVAGFGTETAQLALTSRRDIERIASASQGVRVRRPWLDPLPSRIPLEAITDASEQEGIVVGVSDVPHEQRQAVVCFEPERDGHLLVTGAARSGKSALLALIAAQHSNHALVAGSLETAWDLVCSLAEHGPLGDEGARDQHESGSTHTSPFIALIDDLDAVCSRFDEFHRSVFIENLMAVLREARARGVIVVATIDRLPAELRNAASLFTSRMALANADKHDYVAAGGSAELWSPNLPPGAGEWRQQRVQLAIASQPVSAADAVEPSPLNLEPGKHYALVSRRAHHASMVLAAQFGNGIHLERVPSPGAGWGAAETRGDTASLSVSDAASLARVTVGDPDEWQSNWALLAKLRESATLLFDGCSPSELRTISRSREPAPATEGSDRILALTTDGEWSRLRWSRRGTPGR